MVTIVADALNCQRETAEAIIRDKGDYLLDAKESQPTLEQEISDYVQDESLRKTMDCKTSQKKTGIGLRPELRTPRQK